MRKSAPMSFGSGTRSVLGESVLGGDNLDSGANELPMATMGAISLMQVATRSRQCFMQRDLAGAGVR
nr:hypothetical protein CFP56_29100 [Quercus suber]